MTEPLKIYRIVCTITSKALVSGSDLPHYHRGEHLGRKGYWYERGDWSARSTTFWKGQQTVRGHLQNLCHDWQRRWRPARHPQYSGHTDTWCEPIPDSLDWSRLQHLLVQQFVITEFSVVKLPAHDFMGIPEAQAA